MSTKKDARPFSTYKELRALIRKDITRLEGAVGVLEGQLESLTDERSRQATEGALTRYRNQLSEREQKLQSLVGRRDRRGVTIKRTDI